MLRRLRSLRSVSLAYGAWFALVGLVPASSLPCPMHPSAAGTEAVAAGPAHDGATHAGHHGSAPSAETTGDPSTEPCDCATTCCGVPVIALPDAPAGVALVESGVREPVAVHRTLWHAAPRERVQPFANGPPIRLLA